MADNDRIAFVQSPVLAAPAAVASGTDAAAGAGASKLWAAAEPSFHDVLDALNPLHQIPIVSSVYESATGDNIGFLPRLVGGALFGGPLGFGAALASGLFEQATGKTLGESLIAAFGGGNDNPDAGDGQTQALVASRSGGRDGEGVLAFASPTSLASAPSSLIADAATLAASRSGGRDGNIGLEIASPASLSGAPPPLIADASRLAANGNPQPTPQQRAEQLALQAAHEARFGRPNQPLLQQASLLAAGMPAGNGSQTGKAGIGGGTIPVALAMPHRPIPVAALAQPSPPTPAADSAAAPASAAADAGPAGFMQTVPPEGVPKAMMQALDKYQLFLRHRQAAGANPGQQVDTSL